MSGGSKSQRSWSRQILSCNRLAFKGITSQYARSFDPIIYSHISCIVLNRQNPPRCYERCWVRQQLLIFVGWPDFFLDRLNYFPTAQAGLNFLGVHVHYGFCSFLRILCKYFALHMHFFAKPCSPTHTLPPRFLVLFIPIPWSLVCLIYTPMIAFKAGERLVSYLDFYVSFLTSKHL